jgi:hypothetical protein
MVMMPRDSEASSLQGFEIGNDVRGLPYVEPELRHIFVTGANAFHQGLL